MSRIRRLERIEARMLQQERLADAEGLRELADTTCAWLMACLAVHRNGKTVPLKPSTDSGGLDATSGARKQLWQRLRETGDRLRQHME